MAQRRSKTWLWILTSILILVIAGYAGWYYFKKDLANPNSKVAKPLLTDKIKDLIIGASDSLYHLEYDKFELNIDSGRGVITRLKLLPDSAVYKRLIAEGKVPNNIMYISADSVILNNFGFSKTSAGRRFTINDLVLKHPVIRIINKRRPWNNNERNDMPSMLSKLAKGLLNITAVKNLVVNDLLFTWVNDNTGSERKTVFEHWNVKVTGFNAFEARSRTDSTKKATAYHADLFRVATPDSLYYLDFNGYDFSPENRLMTIGRVELRPRLSKPAFYRAVKYDKDRIHLLYKNVAFHHIDIDRILKKQRFHFGKATVGSFWGEVENNYRWPKRKRPIRSDPYPHQRLKRIAFDVTIDTMIMHKSDFRYVIAARKSSETSSFFMTNTESRFYNVTNDRQTILRKPYTICRTQTYVMGMGLLNTTFNFNLLSKNGAFTMISRMGAMDATALNPLARPLALMSVRKGRINEMYMQVSANNKQATGHLDLYYKGLKLDFLKRDDKTDTLKKRGFLSFLTNTFTPDDNPQKNGKFRKGPINVARDPRESFFGLLWKCSLDGMSSAMTGFEQHKKNADGSIITRTLKKIIKPHKKEVARGNK